MAWLGEMLSFGVVENVTAFTVQQHDRLRKLAAEGIDEFGGHRCDTVELPHKAREPPLRGSAAHACQIAATAPNRITGSVP